jgi:hypothetical protein
LGNGKGQNPYQGGLRHLHLLHDGPLWDLDLLELNDSHVFTFERGCLASLDGFRSRDGTMGTFFSEIAHIEKVLTFFQ